MVDPKKEAGDSPSPLKTCTTCKTEKPIAEFYRTKKGRFGVAAKCKFCARLEMKERYRANPEAAKERALKWKEDNRERALEIGRDKNRRRRKSPQVRISESVSWGIWEALRRGKGGAKAFSMLGYSVDELMDHLERKFLPGMTWENYGKNGWEIDHIIPKSAFNFTDHSHADFKRCWDLQNLQPLWKKDNISKFNRMAADFQPSLAL